MYSVALQESRKRVKKLECVIVIQRAPAISHLGCSLILSQICLIISPHVYQTCSIFLFFFVTQQINFICLEPRLLAAYFLSLSPSVPLQDEKNQVLITNAWLQLVRLPSKRFLCDHSVIIVILYIFGKCACVLFLIFKKVLTSRCFGRHGARCDLSCKQ